MHPADTATEAGPGQQQQQEEDGGLAEEAATAASELFCALCTKQPAMLLDLLRSYGLVGLPAAALLADTCPVVVGPSSRLPLWLCLQQLVIIVVVLLGEYQVT